MKKNRPIPFTWLLLFAVMVLPGCLEADRVSIVIYDSGRDVFRHLRLYLDIASGWDADSPAEVSLQSEEYNYLEALWKNRQDLIPIPEYTSTGRTGSIYDQGKCLLYVSNHAFKTIMLSEKRREPELVTTPLSLDDIAIKPGTFFQSSRGTLCYYHQTEVPGKTLDRLLLVSSDALCEYLVDAIPKERLRRQKGGSVLGWNLEQHKLRQSFKNSSSSVVTSPDDPNQTNTNTGSGRWQPQPNFQQFPVGDKHYYWNPETNTYITSEGTPVTDLDEIKRLKGEKDSTKNPASWPLGILDDNSLRWLLSKAASRELRIKRNKYQLEFQLILSPVDARQLVSTAGMLTNLANDNQSSSPFGADMRQLRTRLSAITFKEEPESAVNARYRTVSVQLDLMQFFSDGSDKLKWMSLLKQIGLKDSEKTRKRSVAAVKEVTQRGIPVGARADNLNWLITAFRHGTLK